MLLTKKHPLWLRVANSKTVFITMILTVVLAYNAQAENYAIVPGHSIGKIWLGAKHKTVQEILGKPAETYLRSKGILEEVWFQQQKDDLRYQYKVLYRKDRVVQIETNSPLYSTWGISLHSDPLEIRQRFKPLRVRTSAFGQISEADIKDYSHPTRYYYSNAQRGITFTVAVQGWREVATKFHTVIVHRKRYRVIAHRGDRFVRMYWDTLN